MYLRIELKGSLTENREIISQQTLYHQKGKEHELVKACIDHDRKAQKRLYEMYCDAMYSSSFRILNDHELASDAIQEAFIHVFRVLGQFQFRSTLGAWIKTIVVHSSLKILKKQKTFIITELDDSVEHASWNEPMSGEYLEKAILSLPDGYRVIFLLVEVEGYKHREVAEMLNISEGTSKSQLFRAKKYLKNILSAQ